MLIRPNVRSLPILCFLLALHVFGTTSTSAQEAPTTPCDLYAASDDDLQRKSDPIPQDRIRGSIAVAACTAAVAQYPNSLRLTYQLGRSLYANSELQKASEQFRKAAEQGYAAAQLDLAISYAGGFGVTKDSEQAFLWFRKAADQGIAFAQNAVGFEYANGRGVPKNDEQAVAWFLKAAEQGYAPALSSLREMYANDRGGARQNTRVATLLRDATEENARAADPEKLLKQAIALSQAGNNAEAVPLAERALGLLEHSTGQNSNPELTKVLDTLAHSYFELRRWNDAERLYKRSLLIKETAPGVDQNDVIETLGYLGDIYANQERNTDREQVLRQIASISEKMNGRDNIDTIVHLEDLANIICRQGRIRECEPLLIEALRGRENTQGTDNVGFRQAAGALANIYISYNRLADAATLIRRIVAIQENAFGKDNFDSLLKLSDILIDLGEYGEAEQVIKRAALAANTEQSNIDQLSGRLYLRQGRYADAEMALARSIDAETKSAYASEKRLFDQCNDVRLNPKRYAEFAAQLCVGRTGDPDIFVRQFVLPTDVIVENNELLAEIYSSTNRYQKAVQLYKEVLAIREKRLTPNHYRVALTLNGLANVYRNQAHYADAEAIYRRALPILKSALRPNHPDISSSQNGLAELYNSQGRYVEALSLARSAARNGFPDRKAYLSILLAAVGKSIISKGDATSESYQIVQQTNASAASAAISQLAIRFAAGTDELAQTVRKDQDLSAEYVRLDKALLTELSKTPNERDASRETIIKKRLQEIADARADIGQRFPDFAALYNPKPLIIKDTQSLLGDDEALVLLDFAVDSYAWVITRTSADWIKLQIAAEDIDGQVKMLRTSLNFRVDKSFDTELAFTIYQETFGAFADKIASKRRISVVTNGALTSFPLQLLVTKDPSGKTLKNADWFVRSHAITILPSVASLKTLRRGGSTVASASKSMIAFADPIFSQETGNQVVALRGLASYYSGGQPDLVSLARALPQLPETADEVRSIAKVIKANINDLKLGTFASETTVKQTKLDDYRIVYFATHALVAGEVEKFAKVKAEPALVLTIPDKPTELDDGLLTASEVALLKLNADWVVLSACNTAAEEKPGAEALSGLARAFFYAGARSLVVSNWEVDSDATVDLWSILSRQLRLIPSCLMEKLYASRS